MNWDRIEGNWKQVKGKVKQQWGKLTDDASGHSRRQPRPARRQDQENYGIAKDEAERQVKDWESRNKDLFDDTSDTSRRMSRQ